ncbi:hypothetical protein RA307_04745 [Xanthobacteraceae bacterium Astr-EGSB]|uniref:hypothetical protein n=1 Tax=Astrobacterium formosum TaxID=3069710 RepID=UPI0027B7CB79|nr:hypothetical protein [Xanthobacteraceae bacterium Astr-EGSB]
MVSIPFPKTSAPGSGGRMINCRHDLLPASSRSVDVWRRAPGLRAFATTARSGHRGSILVGSTLYTAFANNITRFDSVGAATSVGTLSGTDGVFWARNNKLPTPDIVVVDPGNGAFVVTSSSVSSYPDADLPAANSVTFMDGYFFFTTGDGRCFASDLNSTAINASTYISAEGRPDGLLRAIAFSDLYLAGTGSIEVWHNTAETAPAFPFRRLGVIPKGIIGRYAISGFEDGIGKGIVFVGDDKIVYALNGYTPTPISSPDVEAAIAAFIEAGGDPNSIKMFPYVVAQRPSIVLRTTSWTWVLDMTSLEWHERESHLAPTWRATGSVFAFNKWLCGDIGSGNLMEISEFARDEIGGPLLMTLESGQVATFPSRAAVAEAVFDVRQGVGVATGADPMQTDPTIAISHTDDGRTWSTPRYRKLGRQAVTAGPVKLVKCGSTKTQGRRWRLQVSDAVDVEVYGGDMSAEPRRA